MRLFEIADNPLPWQITKSSKDEVIYQFDLEDGRTVEVSFYSSPAHPDGVWVAVFNDVGDTRSDVYKLNNKGSEFQVFSTVIRILLDFLNTHEDVFKLIFEAEESNRQSLYARMLKKYIKPPFHFKVNGNTMVIVNNDRMKSATKDLE